MKRKIELTSRKVSKIDKLLKRAKLIIDDKTGIIKKIYETPIDPDDLKLFHYWAVKINMDHRLTKKIQLSGGVSLVRKKAIIKAIGESIERYCSSIYDEESFIYESYKNLKENALDPRTLPLCSEREYKKNRNRENKLSEFFEDSKINWVWGYSIIKGDFILVPSCFVYLPYHFKNKEEFFWIPTSSGLACGGTIEEAILKAILEVFERDALMIMWLNKLSMPRVVLSNIKDRELNEIILMLKNSNFKIIVNNLTNDIDIPVFCSWLIDKSGNSPAITLGISSNLNPEIAIRKSIYEAEEIRFSLKKILKVKNDINYENDFSNIKTFEDHALLYCKHSMIPKLNFIINSKKTKNIRDIKNISLGNPLNNINLCIDKINKRGLDIIVFDITTEDIRDLGFFVVRVIIPGMQPLNSTYNFRFLGGKRLYEVPKMLGYKKNNTSEEELNLLPHPFI